MSRLTLSALVISSSKALLDADFASFASIANKWQALGSLAVESGTALLGKSGETKQSEKHTESAGPSLFGLSGLRALQGKGGFGRCQLSSRQSRVQTMHTAPPTLFWTLWRIDLAMAVLAPGGIPAKCRAVRHLIAELGGCIPEHRKLSPKRARKEAKKREHGEAVARPICPGPQDAKTLKFAGSKEISVTK